MFTWECWGITWKSSGESMSKGYWKIDQGYRTVIKMLGFSMHSYVEIVEYNLLNKQPAQWDGLWKYKRI